MTFTQCESVCSRVSSCQLKLALVFLHTQLEIQFRMWRSEWQFKNSFVLLFSCEEIHQSQKETDYFVIFSTLKSRSVISWKFSWYKNEENSIPKLKLNGESSYFGLLIVNIRVNLTRWNIFTHIWQKSSLCVPEGILGTKQQLNWYPEQSGLPSPVSRAQCCLKCWTAHRKRIPGSPYDYFNWEINLLLPQVFLVFTFRNQTSIYTIDSLSLWSSNYTADLRWLHL